ncbi:hypothetical protein HIM_10175 [Hirsutella minnesotensis 3608]|uniref:RNase H type-1 domain-containing protein n=1 Tax=Hirsutella minnesotensis 3608 TaxID=1043627 RepID=A0A0F7ZXB6_9HYPO|nr:hypothetical protein HIM_10175 [Hirsutella minnesotensis 3608]
MAFQRGVRPRSPPFTGSLKYLPQRRSYREKAHWQASGSEASTGITLCSPKRAWKQKFCSRLWRLLAQTPRLEPPPLPRPQPPSMGPTGGMSKAEGAQAFRDWLKRAEDTDDIIVYSDGSQTKSSPAVPGQTGSGFSVHRAGKEITAGAGRITHGEVYDGEIIGAITRQQLERSWGTLEVPRSTKQ